MVTVETAFNKVTGMDVHMGTHFEQQFNPAYMSRVFPWSLNYSCGGADYPGLFSNWEMPEDNEQVGVQPSETMWRRGKHGEAPLHPGPYAQMLATRVEMQVAGDWMLVPAARNLHWRYEVLHSAFIVCKQRLAPTTNMEENLRELIAATDPALSTTKI